MSALKEVSRFHGHMCPGLAIGYRVSEFALKKLGKRAADEELMAIVENDSCAVDAIQYMTGCTFGKGNLIFRDYGKQVYTFIKRPEGIAIRISVHWDPPEETKAEKAMWKMYTEGDRSSVVLKAVRKRKSRKIEAILKADEKSLFKLRRMKAATPPEAKIFKSIRCESCGEKVSEHRARIMSGKTVCIPCFEKG
jgi:formylmethanofuran dehydrogenase subunit E